MCFHEWNCNWHRQPWCQKPDPVRRRFVLLRRATLVGPEDVPTVDDKNKYQRFENYWICFEWHMSPGPKAQRSVSSRFSYLLGTGADLRKMNDQLPCFITDCPSNCSCNFFPSKPLGFRSLKRICTLSLKISFESFGIVPSSSFIVSHTVTFQLLSCRYMCFSITVILFFHLRVFYFPTRWNAMEAGPHPQRVLKFLYFLMILFIL